MLLILPESISQQDIIYNQDEKCFIVNSGTLTSEELDELINTNLEIFKDIQVLGLMDNKLKTLPNSMENCIKLQELFLSKNELEILPDFIGNLNNLKRLILDENQLTDLPESLKKLDLNHLSIRDNPFDKKNLPPIFKYLIERMGKYFYYKRNF